VDAGSLGVAPLTQGLIDSPTPGSPSPATPQGTLNDATPSVWSTLLSGLANAGNEGGPAIDLGNISPVLSYLTTDVNTGGSIVLNVTQPGHPLFPGVVARYVSQTEAGTVVNNVGEGASQLQAPSSLAANEISGVWQGQTQQIINNVSNQAATSSGEDTTAAAGGYLLYPNMPNTNSLIWVYSKGP